MASPTHDQDADQLASLGYKQEFKRDFTTLELFGLGFSVIGVVPSIASVLFYSIPYGGPVVMVWGWTICTVFLMFIALSMAELGSAAPTSGGVYYWTFKFSPPSVRNYLCWIIGYVNTISYISAVAGFEWGCAVEIMAAVSIGTDLTFTPTLSQTYGVYAALIICHAVICSLATKVIARLQLLYVALNIGLCLAIFIGLPTNVSANLKNSASYAFGHFENASTWSNGFAFVLSFLAPLWVIGGFDATVHISEEARNANIAIPWAIISATSLGCVLGWLINVVLVFTMGQDIGSIIESPIGQPLATIILNVLGKKQALTLWSFIIITQFTMSTSILTSSSRQIFAFSRDGALPFSKYLYYVNRSNRVPTRAVLASAISAILLGLIVLGGPAASAAIFAMGVVGQYICNSTVIATRWLGGSPFKSGPFSLGKLSLPISAAAVLFMVLMVVVLLFPAEPQVDAASMNYTVLVFGGAILLSTLYYFFPVYGGIHWFTGPVKTLMEDENRQGRQGTIDVESGSEKGQDGNADD